MNFELCKVKNCLYPDCNMEQNGYSGSISRYSTMWQASHMFNWNI